MFNARRSGLKIAQEYIAIQKPETVKQVEILFEGILEALPTLKGESDSRLINAIPEFKMLEEFTFERFGIQIAITHSNSTMLGVLPLILNKHHIFLDEFYHGFQGIDHQEAVLAKWDRKKGTVDLKKAKVGGIFSEYRHLFMINLRFITDVVGLTAQELTGTYLHEIGHLFTNFEFSNRLEHTNTLMANLSQSLKTEPDPGKIEYIYREYIELVGATEDKDLLTQGESRVVIGNKAFKNYFDYVKSQWPNSKYAETNSEASADLFATRFGYGRHLANALYKLHTKTGIEHDQALMSTVSSVFDTLRLGMPMLGIVVGLTGASFGVAGFCMMLLILNVYQSGTDFKDLTYDDLKDRYLRVRQQLVEVLKDTSLETGEAQRMLEAIYSVDKIIKSVATFRPWSQKLADVFFTRHRRADNDIRLQRLLEQLAHNDLFVKSAEFAIAAKQL